MLALLDSVVIFDYNLLMPEVVRENGFRICVYREQGGRHHVPHCHIYWADGSAQIDLLTLRVLKGAPIPQRGQAVLEKYRELINVRFDEINQ